MLKSLKTRPTFINDFVGVDVYALVNIFQSWQMFLGWTRLIKCLTQGHYTVPLVIKYLWMKVQNFRNHLSSKCSGKTELMRLLVLSFTCFVWFDYVSVNNFSVMWGRVSLGWTSTKQEKMCLAQGHNTVTLVRLEPGAPQSRAKHPTTEPLCSLSFTCNIIYVIIIKIS